MVSLLLLRSVGHRDDFCCVPLKRSQFLHSQRNQMNEFGEFSGIFFWGPQWGRGQAPPSSFHSTLILPPRGLLYTLRRCFSTVLPKNLPKAGKAQINRLCSTLCISFSSVQFSHSIVSDSLRPHGLQHARLPCPSPTPGACPNSCPSSRLCHSPSHPLLSPSPSAFGLAQHQGLFKWVSSLHQVAKVLELQLRHQSFQWIFTTDFL